ncbi:phenylalanine--tRNA ligase subunit beta [Brachybacterium sp. HMSC06H03]|uniref:phenylalanine--tRNA ligase subunit beta n=1 Tax=Brachybacterium sp. HMSC06H03 TaxID=1581127 RepID=UPI0008A59EA1|nr:phenylalanine--tRNA ligase subunit beta [Brachybacterium sp. HMSC06H03]OFT56143.1 phenylalanine--tRNA ligase subunit beta [Brachybacterium sp. HMSC06H03]
MPRIPLTWLGEHVELPATAPALEVATDLSRVGLEEEAIFGAQVTGPLVVGRVLELVKEPQKNGKTINWVRVDVGPEHNEDADDPKDPQPGEERPSRGIICGAHNFVEGDLVVVSLPGTVLPGDFAIAARKTYGHTSDGMICSGEELGLGPDPDGEDGIIVLGRGHARGLTAEPGDDAIALLGLADEVVEINVTPDRGYCFSMRGVAREYGHATGAAFTDPASEVAITATEAGGVPVQMRDEAPLNGAEGCTRFVALEVEGVDPAAQTPRWMARRLTLAGMRPISLIVDVTNYVMLDLGQPLHAYDAEKLVGPITVRRARKGEELTTLDDVERTLDPEDLLITDAGGPAGDRVLGLAGVMGGEDTEVSDATTSIVLEAATFDPVTVARTARRHRLPSEASKRFERGVDPQLPLIAAHRAAQLIVEHGGGTVSARVTDEGSVAAPAPISADLHDAERVVGIAYTDVQVISSLEAIGCTVAREGEDGLLVTPPSWRPDLTIREDLVEEIARLVGYAEIPSVLPTAPGGRGLTVAQRGRRAARRALAEAGLVEVNSAPFVAGSVHDRLRYGTDDARREAVRILNPLSEDEPLLRTELLQSLLPTARRNLGRGEESVAIFQRGSVFLASGGQGAAPVPAAAQRPSEQELEAILAALPAQTGALAAVVGGASGPDSWQGEPAPWGWTDALDLARRAAAAVGAELEVRQTEHAPFHPGRAAELRVHTADGDSRVVGAAGELHPAVLKEFDLPARSAAFELDLEAVIAAAPSVVRAVPVPTYPPAKEDFAFVVEESVPASAVEAAIVVGAGDLAERVHLFDVFTGEQIGEGKKSLAFAIRLRSVEGTLTAEQIGETRRRIIAAVQSAVGGVLRA